MRSFDWDDKKARINLAKPKVSFDSARLFEFDGALVVQDDDIDYGEIRLVGTGFIGRKVHVIVYTERGEVIWVISLREARRREIEAYVEYIERGW